MSDETHTDPLGQMTPEELEVMRHRVKIAAAVALLVAIGAIALSAATLKTDQVNKLPPATLGTR